MTDEKMALLSLAMRVGAETERQRESLRYQGRGEPLTSLAQELARQTIKLLKDNERD